MAIDATRFSRVSIGWRDSAQSIVDLDAGDTGDAFSVTGNATFDDNVTVSGTLTQTGAQTFTGAATFSSTVSIAGNTTHTGTVSVGAGTAIAYVQSSTISIGGAAVTGNDSIVSNYAVSGATGGDQVLITPDTSLWSGAYHDIDVSGFGAGANLVAVAMRNSAETDITPDAMNMRVTVIRF